MRITTIRHDYEWIEWQGRELKYGSLSSGISTEGLSVLLLSSVLGRKGLQGRASCPRVLLSFFSCSFSIPILGGSLSLYISFQSILAFHLLIMQVITRVFVPSATFPNPLWVAATKTALFRGHFLINVAKTLVGCIQCGCDSFSLNCSYTIPP